MSLFRQNSLRPVVAAAAAALLLAVVGCAEDAKDPDVENLESSGKGDDDDTGDGDLSKPAKKPIKTEENSESDDDGDGAKAASDDGYDDNWNNIGSQQAKPAQEEDQQNDENDEPPVQNAKPEPVEEPIAEAPANPPPEPTPPPEPPADQEPAPVAEEPPEMKPVVSGAPLIRQDLTPVSAELVWVGYDFLEHDSVVKIELVTRGMPKYNIFQERNRQDQPELVVRFFNTKLRGKVRRDVDASEFRSPVAFLRMRYDEDENAVDVVMTMRDPVQPRLFSKNGNVLLTFPVPDHYFGNSLIGGAPVAKAEVLANTNVMPELDETSDISEGMKIAKAFVNNPGGEAFKQAPADGGEPVNPEPVPLPTAPDGQLPADFTNVPANVPANVPQNALGSAPVGDDADGMFNAGGNTEVDGEPGENGQGQNGGDGFENDAGEDGTGDDLDGEGDDEEPGDGDSDLEIDKFDV